MVHEKFVMFDGIDGSGKTTLARVFVETLAKGGQTIFDLPAASKKNDEIPLPWTPAREIIFSAEPTRAWIGAAIRQELIREGTGYGGATVAEAFALDRLVLYTRFLIPMLERGAMIVQDRGLPSSMTYQPIMPDGLPLDKLLALPGNALALEHAPMHLIIAKCTAKTALKRLAARSGKKDDSIFEREEFLNKLAERYETDWFRRIWKEHGTVLHLLDAEAPLETVTAETVALAKKIYG